MDKKVIDKSAILAGPAGTGKSLHARELSKRTGLPVINLDTMRECPRNVEFLESECVRLDDAIAVNRVLLEKSAGEEREKLQAERNRLTKDHARRSEQLRLRKLLPNLPNYNDITLKVKGEEFNLRFNKVLSENIRDIARNHGVNPNVAWHYYQKPFELALVQNLMEQLDQPAIIDLGGGMPIALEKDYELVEQKAKGLGISEEEFREVMPFAPAQLREMTQDTMAKFPKENVVYLEPPKDMYSRPEKYQNAKGMERLLADGLNPLFIGTKQYEEIAGVTISTKEAMAGAEINFSAVEANCHQMIEKTNIQSLAQDGGQNM